MDCPRCTTTPLTAIDTAEGETVDFCRSCGGTFYDDGELEAILTLPRTVRVRRAGIMPTPGPACPRCQTPMNEVGYPRKAPVRIDVCPGCHGVWLDRAELGDLRKAVRQVRTMTEVEGADGLHIVPIKPPGRRFELYTFLGSLFVLSFTSIATLGLLYIVGALEHLNDDGAVNADELAIVGAALLGVPVGSAIVGRLSPGFTLWEPVAAALPVLLAYVWFFEGVLPPLVIGVVVALGLGLALAGAAVGERIQAG